MNVMFLDEIEIVEDELGLCFYIEFTFQWTDYTFYFSMFSSDGGLSWSDELIFPHVVSDDSPKIEKILFDLDRKKSTLRRRIEHDFSDLLTEF